MKEYFTQIDFQNITSIIYKEDNRIISFTDTDLGNSDYQQYLVWLAEGNTPEEWKVETV